MTDFIWPSDADRAENEELNRVCEYLELVFDERNEYRNHLAQICTMLGVNWSDGTPDIGAAWEGVNAIQEQNRRLQEHQKMDARIIHNQAVSMQAALIAARTNGAEVGMQWIENTLCGPDLLTDEDGPHYHDAQAYRNYYDYDAVIERENQEAAT